MRHVAEILKELGFNEKAPESTKRAFIKHLEAHAKAEISTFSAPQVGEQLEFVFDVENSPAPNVAALSSKK